MVSSDYADEFVDKINSEFTELADSNLKVAVDTSKYDSVTGTIFAGTLGDMILDSQTTSSNELSEKNFGRLVS